MLLSLALQAHAADLPTLPQATCDVLAEGFGVARAGPAPAIPGMSAEELEKGMRGDRELYATDFKAACPYVRGLDAECVRGAGALLDWDRRNAKSLIGRGEFRELTPELVATLPEGLARCLDAGGIGLLTRAVARQEMCDPNRPEPRWAKTCPTAAERARSDLQVSVSGLAYSGQQFVEDSYADQKLPADGRITFGSEANARKAVASAPYTWSPPDEPWATLLGWSPDPPETYAAYWVVVKKGAKGAIDVEVHGIVDRDKDGCLYHVVALNNDAPKPVPGTEACH